MDNSAMHALIDVLDDADELLGDAIVPHQLPQNLPVQTIISFCIIDEDCIQW